MKTDFDLLVYLSLVLVVIVIGIAAYVILKTSETQDLEARKIRFAAATFTGITMLFLFAASLYFAGGKDRPGREIFDKGLTAMFTLAGSIVGYLFGSSRNSTADSGSFENQQKLSEASIEKQNSEVE
jgi:cytochrome bd-type quinol oxidase subunit 2